MQFQRVLPYTTRLTNSLLVLNFVRMVHHFGVTDCWKQPSFFYRWLFLVTGEWCGGSLRIVRLFPTFLQSLIFIISNSLVISLPLSVSFLHFLFTPSKISTHPNKFLAPSSHRKCSFNFSSCAFCPILFDCLLFFILDQNNIYSEPFDPRN